MSDKSVFLPLLNDYVNTYLPVSAYNVLQSIRLLADSMRTFAARCLAGMEARKETMENNLRRSLMLSTLLSPVIGYARAAEAAQKADRENCTLKEACLSLGYLDGETFDALFAPFLKPENTTGTARCSCSRTTTVRTASFRRPTRKKKSEA